MDDQHPVQRSKSAEYREKINQLQDELKKVQTTAEVGRPYSMTTIAACATPLLIFILLFIATPFFVKEKNEDDEDVRSVKKVFIYTLVFTLVVWGGLYYYQNVYTSSPASID